MICYLCKVVDKFNFVLRSFINSIDRDDLFKMIQAANPFCLKFASIRQIFISYDIILLIWVGKFVQISFGKPENYMQLWAIIHFVI